MLLLHDLLKFDRISGNIALVGLIATSMLISQLGLKSQDGWFPKRFLFHLSDVDVILLFSGLALEHCVYFIFDPFLVEAWVVGQMERKQTTRLLEPLRDVRDDPGW